MASVFGLLSRLYKALVPPNTAKVEEQDLVKFGILGAANIAPIALIIPCRSHPSAAVYAVAARDLNRAQTFAKKWNIPHAYGGTNGYQELLDNPEVDAIYIALPNGLHFEWTARALQAGKHVLLEKPSTNTEEETRALFALAREKNLILLEAFHYRFHPAASRVKEILASKELGDLKSIETICKAPSFLLNPDDIRFNYDLGGGALMDLGCYCLQAIQFFSSTKPTHVLQAQHIAKSPNVDRASIASLALSGSTTASLDCDLGVPNKWGIIPTLTISLKVVCENGELQMTNFIMPTLYHSITVKPRGEKARIEKVYGKEQGLGEDWWSTYRYQLEEFVKRIKGEEVRTWMEEEESIENMKWIEAVYKAGGMGSRPASNFVL